jgi:fructokinase
MIDVLSFGESLIDFLPGKTGCPLREVETFRRCLGGAPANLALGVARLGGSSALMCKLGDDEFGHYLRETLADHGVDTRGVVFTSRARTGLAFVELSADGGRRFLFYRHPSADMTIGPEDVDVAVAAEAHIVHAGTNLLVRPANRQATHLVLGTARAAGRLASLDLNLRLHQWPDQAAIAPVVLEAISLVDIVKANDDELAFLCPGLSARDAFHTVFAPRGVTALIVTLGPGGAQLVTAQGCESADAPTVDVVDTTGAGDGFLAGFLRTLTLDGRPNLPTADWSRALRVGNRVGSQVCTAFGATTSLPAQSDLDWE